MSQIIKKLWLPISLIVLITGLFVAEQLCYVTPILTYHNIGDHQVGHLNIVTPQSFDHQMDYIKRHGYKVISFEDYVTAREHGKMPRNSVVIHFDDGYKDNYTKAFPVLKKYDFPATFFVVSDFINQKDNFMTWSQLKEMDKAGYIIGAHTRRHPYLPNLSIDEATDEIAGSKRIIEENLGKPVDFFVYPIGGFSDDIKNIVIKTGFRAAATTNRGRSRFNKDLFELNRIRLKNEDRDIVLWAKLSGYYNLFRSKRTPS